MKQIASLSLDLDNKWSYMKTHGDTGWESFPSYLDAVVPRVLKILSDRDLTITFFIVGQDAALEGNRESIAQIAAAGHEIGNHSFNHEPWLHLYSKPQLVEEFKKTEDALESVTGKRPMGFRGPGFSL
ncbi:MAG: polysaccharide deacetylase family protein, partial [Pyrinomonadaceae bacterium]